MRIGIDFRMGGSINSGIGRYTFELLKGLLAAKSEHTFVIIYKKDSLNPIDYQWLKDQEGLELFEANIRHYSIGEQLWLPGILEKGKFDLIHFPNFNVPIWYKGKFVMTIHDMVHHKISGHKKSTRIFFEGYKYVITKASEQAEKIITISEAAAREIEGFLHVPRERIAVTYEAADVRPVSDEAVTLIKNQLMLRKPYFIFVGTLERKKNVVGLVRGFEEFINRYKLDMDLVIAGKPDRHYPQIQDEALKSSVSNRVVFTNFVFDHELAALYQGAYAFVTASKHEGFGLPGVEAMQFGLPLLASNTEVLNEVYDNAALYFDPDDPKDIAEKMHLLATDKQFYSQVQEKSIKRGQDFSWQKMADQTLAVYEECFKK